MRNYTKLHNQVTFNPSRYNKGTYDVCLYYSNMYIWGGGTNLFENTNYVILSKSDYQARSVDVKEGREK